MRGDKRGPADPVDDAENDASVGGNRGCTGEGGRPLDLVWKGDEVATLVDSSLMGKRVGRPPLLRGNI